MCSPLIRPVEILILKGQCARILMNSAYIRKEKHLPPLKDDASAGTLDTKSSLSSDYFEYP